MFNSKNLALLPEIVGNATVFPGIWGGTTIAGGNGPLEVTAIENQRGVTIIMTDDSPLTAFLGEGANIVYSNGGEDTILGGTGSNEIHTGDGDDTVVSGNGLLNILDVGNGNNNVVYGQWDEIFLREGSNTLSFLAKTGEHGVQPGSASAFVTGFSNDDVVDLSAYTGIFEEDRMSVVGDNFVAETDFGTLTIEGAGEVIGLIGIHAAIEGGMILL
jgi:hypothetical protein